VQLPLVIAAVEKAQLFWKELIRLLSLYYLIVHTVSVVFFNPGKPRTLVAMDTVIKQWVQLWDASLHANGFNCHTRISGYRGYQS
jgi:hypothetical protein